MQRESKEERAMRIAIELVKKCGLASDEAPSRSLDDEEQSSTEIERGPSPAAWMDRLRAAKKRP
jgi:hypothetical protein